MAVRLHPALEQATALSRSVASLIAFTLRPIAVAVLACGMWRLGIDLGWTQDFFVSQGLLSHWQVWIAMSLALYFAAGFLSRLTGVSEDS
ncbi:MAG TPA: hypothetical protein VFA04_04030 [Bryobacteraceae bacterium]|nr:hypothetical protein [Bryobacteraceae bacterium]